MDEKLELSDFDILGIIDLEDVEGIEKFVTKINGNRYLSRSKEYYNVKSMTELSETREKLKCLLDRRINKKNFVILENMLNCSAKVYFKKMEKFIRNRTKENEMEMNLARYCMEEDVKNIIVLLSKNGLINVDPNLVLPQGEENSEKRLIEMDNKALLYIFCRALNLSKTERDIEILNPGYGSIYIGPFIKAMYGNEYTNLLKSKYISDAMINSINFNIRDLITSSRIFESGKRIMLLDDNIGTGDTIQEIRNQLKVEGVNENNIISGAIQYNWINYYKISVGEKKTDRSGNKIKRFNIADYEILSPLNYYGHKLCERAIDRLHSSGEEYIQYLEGKSYRIDGYNDIVGSLERGLQYANMTGVELTTKYKLPERKQREVKPLIDEYKNGRTIATSIGKKSVNNIIKTIQQGTQDRHIEEIQKGYS